MGTTELRAKILSAQRPLPAHTLHVWQTQLASITPLVSEISASLSADEQARSERFRFPEHRDAFVAGRALLRMILGSYCGCAPEELRFTTGAQGKPRIDEQENRLSRTVSFNLSHSTKVVQISIAAEAETGIDVEDLSRDFDLEGLMAECLTVEESRLVRLSTPAQQRAAFLRYWVHKEAFLKCVGTGFSVSPREVHVSFNDGGRSEIICSNPMADRVLFGRDLECEAGHRAAIASPEREYVLQSIAL